jgi:hypothetical protein
MAIITNNQTGWKQNAMQQAERLTDTWDVIKAWAGRAAEIVLTVCMFISLIGMLPAVHYWVWVTDSVLAVQMIMLDFGGFALHTLAEHARDGGQLDAAKKAERMANFLIGLVILSMAIITVGQLSGVFGPAAATVTNIVKYAEPVLILVRVVSSVKYIHTIHSLRGSGLHLQALPTSQADLDRIATLTEQVRSLEDTLAKSSTRFTEALRSQEEKSSAQLTEALRSQEAKSIERIETILKSVQSPPSVAAQPEKKEKPANTRPSASQGKRASTAQGEAEKFDKAAFVRACLQKDRTMSIGSIQRIALEQGQRIAGSYVSEVRNGFLGDLPNTSPNSATEYPTEGETEAVINQ